MNNLFIKVYFSIICALMLMYMISYSMYEAKNNKNIFGSVFIIFFSIFSTVLSNYVFWIN